MVELSLSIVEFFAFCYRLLRKPKIGRNAIRTMGFQVKNRLLCPPASLLHKTVHEIRKIALNDVMLKDTEDTYETLVHLANACKDVMTNILEGGDKDIHCTIKLIHKDSMSEKLEDGIVYTIARSERSNRPYEFGRDHKYTVAENSAFASLTGIDDGASRWNTYIPSAFICRDLKAHSPVKFMCKRMNWQSYYNATAVFPLRFKKISDSQHTVFGFLTFDTKNPLLSKFFPCIYCLDSDRYEEEIFETSLFHVGSVLADTLTCIFYPLLENNKTHKGSDGAQ